MTPDIEQTPGQGSTDWPDGGEIAKLIELLPAAVYTCKAPTGAITYYNPSAAELWGRIPKPGDTDERFCGSFRLWRPDGTLLPHDQTPMAAALREGREFRNEEVIIERPDGSRISVLVNINPIRDKTGKIVGAVNAFQDITALRQAEEALRDREKRYNLVVAGAGAAIWDWDVPNKRVDYSQRWKQLRGLSDAEVSDSEEEWSQRIHPDDVERVLAAAEAHLQGHTDTFSEEYRVRHKDGHWVWINDRGIALRDAEGRVVRMAGSEIDITARKQSEDALRESEMRFRTLADSAPVLIWIDGPEGCEYVSRAYLDFLGVEQADVQRDGWKRFVHPDDREEYLKAYVAAAAKRETFSAQFRFRRRDGEFRWMKSLGFPRLTAGRELQGYVGATLDITDIREAQEVLRDADRRKDEFLAMLGHELRNPLAAISNGITLLKGSPLRNAAPGHRR